MTPNVAWFADLHGLTAGNPVGKYVRFRGETAPEARAKSPRYRYYPYHGILSAIEDLEAGRIGLVIKLLPVIGWLVKDRPGLSVRWRRRPASSLGVAFAPGRADLCEAVDAAIRALRASGDFAKLQARWPGTRSDL